MDVQAAQPQPELLIRYLEVPAVSKAKLAIALSTLIVAAVAWAVPGKGIAHQRVEN